VFIGTFSGFGILFKKSGNPVLYVKIFYWLFSRSLIATCGSNKMSSFLKSGKSFFLTLEAQKVGLSGQGSFCKAKLNHKIHLSPPPRV
jgi:hypothetical protein